MWAVASHHENIYSRIPKLIFHSLFISKIPDLGCSFVLLYNMFFIQTEDKGLLYTFVYKQMIGVD